MAGRLPMGVRLRASPGAKHSPPSRRGGGWAKGRWLLRRFARTVPQPPPPSLKGEKKAWASALGVVCRALVALSLGAALATPAQAQSPAPTPLQAAPSPAAPSQAAPAAPAAAAPATALTQVVTLPAGTGMLLRLAASRRPIVMSANPAVARVQPASPTSLFRMAGAAGRTTVLATAESGTAIVQYDISLVTPGDDGAPPPSAAAAAPLIPRWRSAQRQRPARRHRQPLRSRRRSRLPSPPR